MWCSWICCRRKSSNCSLSSRNATRTLCNMNGITLKYFLYLYLYFITSLKSWNIGTRITGDAGASAARDQRIREIEIAGRGRERDAQGRNKALERDGKPAAARIRRKSGARSMSGNAQDNSSRSSNSRRIRKRIAGHL